MTDHQEKARELLDRASHFALVECINEFEGSLARELRAALDRENIIADHNADLRRKLAKAEHDRDRYAAEVERLRADEAEKKTHNRILKEGQNDLSRAYAYATQILKQSAQALLKNESVISQLQMRVRELESTTPASRQHCENVKAGGVHCSWAPESPQAFTGRITGRNRADIPSDAGVPPHEQDAGYGEGWSVEPLGTFAREADAERGIAWPDAMCNDPDRYRPDEQDVARAIGQEDAKP